MSKHTPEDEEWLIVRSKRGDLEAFNKLIERYQQLMYASVLRMLGNTETAADVTQDAFLSAFRHIDSFKGGSSFRAWLLRIGSNLACDHWRYKQRHPAASLDMLTDSEEPHAQETLNSLVTSAISDNPEEQLLTHELQALIQRGLQDLPLEQRVAVVLCDIEGFSYEEVATATETSLGTVRSRISRGRSRLRQYLVQHRELLPRDYRLTN
ncbi:RNA polymerase sigma factor [Ktedonospora formicarum]|uniref:RNA polymerase subunit sigma-24 n=1 Tax=Ktedonospora formicarum TaxID=2778364 RepID=A0A8J3HZH2_9CHLR|nr:sigma-70 family RNA polymerase sigma factor [Ktedonospora formicarum]GHO44836.1 RNA polymerase subunit sigma-24 [Ktedonospora formicarum]